MKKQHGSRQYDEWHLIFLHASNQGSRVIKMSKQNVHINLHNVSADFHHNPTNIHNKNAPHKWNWLRFIFRPCKKFLRRTHTMSASRNGKQRPAKNVPTRNKSRNDQRLWSTAQKRSNPNKASDSFAYLWVEIYYDKEKTHWIIMRKRMRWVKYQQINFNWNACKQLSLLTLHNRAKLWAHAQLLQHAAYDGLLNHLVHLNQRK